MPLPRTMARLRRLARLADEEAVVLIHACRGANTEQIAADTGLPAGEVLAHAQANNTF